METITGYHDLVRSDVLHLVPFGARRVLDIGGGVGANAPYLKAHKGCEYYALTDQVADDRVAEVNKAYTGDLEGVSLVKEIGIAEEPFDAILFLDILEHLRDPWRLVDMCSQMLVPGGVMIASLPNIRHTSVTFPLVFQGRFDLQDKGIMDRTHLRWFTRKTAVEMMARGDMVFDHIEPRIYQRSRRLLNRLAFGVLEGHLAQQYFIRVVRK